MSVDVISAFADAIGYFDLSNLQIAFEALKLLNVNFDSEPDENGNIGCIDCINCKKCIFCIECVGCENCQICAFCEMCKKCWYCSQLNGDDGIHNICYDVMRNEPLTEDDEKILIEFVDYVKELLN